MNMQEAIAQTCDELKTFLLEKNKAYGDSASKPVRIFSKTDTLEQINVRIDDKLSRIARGNEYDGDDTELDLIGYLILKRAIKRCEVQTDAIKEYGRTTSVDVSGVAEERASESLSAFGLAEPTAPSHHLSKECTGAASVDAVETPGKIMNLGAEFIGYPEANEIIGRLDKEEALDAGLSPHQGALV